MSHRQNKEEDEGKTIGMLRKIIPGWAVFAILTVFAKWVAGGPWTPYLVTEVAGVMLLLGMVLYMYGVAMRWYTRNAQMQRAVSNPSDAASLPFECFRLNRPMDVQIEGWFIPEPVHPELRHSAVIYSHGFGNSREMCGDVTYRQMTALHTAGYGIFTFDYPYGDRAHSHPMTAGIEESRDLLAVVDTCGRTAMPGWQCLGTRLAPVRHYSRPSRGRSMPCSSTRRLLPVCPFWWTC